MNEKVEELYEGLKERLKSSFLITFIPIWLLHHWRLVYTIFNFDSDQLLKTKTYFISHYISEQTFLWLWVMPVLWTFISIIGFYGLSSLSEILNIGYHNTRKMIYKKFDDKKLKFSSEYEDLEKRYLKQGDDLKNARLEHNKLLQENKDLQTNINGLTTKNETLIKNQNTTTEEKTKELKKEKDDAIKQVKKFKEFIKENQEFQDKVEAPLLTFMAKHYGINNQDILLEQSKMLSTEPRDLMEGKWLVRTYKGLNLGSYNESSYEIQGRNVNDSKTDTFLGGIKSFNYNRATKIVTFSIATKDQNTYKVKLVAESRDKMIGFWENEVVSFNKIIDRSNVQ